MSRNFIISLILFLCLAGTCAWIFFGSLPKPDVQKSALLLPETSDDSLGTKTPTITIKNITLKETEKSKGYELLVTAEESNFNHLSDNVMCTTVTGSVTRHGVNIASLKADTAQIDRSLKKVLFQGAVHGNLKELCVEGRDITYNFSTNIIETKHLVTYTHEQFTFCAQQSRIDINANNIQMSNGVHSQFSYISTTNNSR